MSEAEQGKVLVLDVGGHHISAAAFNLRDESLGEIGHVELPETERADSFIDTVQALCGQLLPARAATDELAGLAMAMPNPFDYERGISYMRHKFQQLYGVDLRQELARRLGLHSDAIYFLNDAAAYLMGEIHQGAAAGIARAVGITLGTGIGSAFAVDGQIVVHGPGVPPGGEIWNLPYRGATVEDFAGTHAIQLLHLERTGVAAQVRDIAAQAKTDDAARETFVQFGRQLGQLLRFTTSGFAPQRIVIGGGIARSAALFLPTAQAELDGLGIELRESLLSDRAPLIGAAMSWKSRPAAAAHSREPIAEVTGG